MLHCFLNSMNCKLFHQAAFEGATLSAYPPAMYVGVTNGPNAITDLTGRLIALLTGTKVPLAKEECKTNRTDLVGFYLCFISFKINAFFLLDISVFVDERHERGRNQY
jgi:hypothetical protein